ncbi:MAG: hypothetical protein IH599_03385, partial [Bacteroidales bacterium]|nr:hypothetical protein [Bacteroidales bacterium]
MKKIGMGLLMLLNSYLGAQDTCIGPDNGLGTTSLYPLGCGWITEAPLLIANGLPPGTNILMNGRLTITGCPAAQCNLTHPP